MSKRIQLLLFAISAGFLHSCSPTYFPPQINTPLLNRKGETKLNFSWSGSSINWTAAHAINDNWLIGGGANLFFVGASSIAGTSVGGSSGIQGEVLGGYYKKFRNRAIFEGLAGGGLSTVSSDDHTGLAYRLFIQPSIGFRGDRAEGAFSLRVVDFASEEEVFIDFDPFGGQIFRSEFVNRLFLEPAFTYRIGGPKVRFTSQLIVSIPTTDVDIEWQPLILNLGVQMLITRNKR